MVFSLALLQGVVFIQMNYRLTGYVGIHPRGCLGGGE